MSSRKTEQAFPNTITLRANCCSIHAGWFRWTNKKSLAQSNMHAARHGFDVSAIGGLEFDDDQENNTIRVLRQIDLNKFDHYTHGQPGLIVTCRKCFKVTCHFYDWNKWNTVVPNRNFRERVNLRWDDKLAHNQRTWRNLQSVEYHTSAYCNGYDRRTVNFLSIVPPEIITHSDFGYASDKVHLSLMDRFWEAYCTAETSDDFNAKFNTWTANMATACLNTMVIVQKARDRAEQKFNILATAAHNAAVAIQDLKDGIRSEKLKNIRRQLEQSLEQAGLGKIN